MAAITFLPPFNAMTIQTTSSKWHTSEADWEPHRALIRQLYLEEDRPLKDVMAFMEQEHGFKATVRMYKNRITKWKLDKRNKESEVLAIVRKKRQRDALGKPSEFHLRGRVVSIDDVSRYLKRKGMSIEDMIDLRAATPPDLRCRTPDAVPPSPANPEIFEARQQVFVGIRNYILGSVDSKMWALDKEGAYYVKSGATNQNSFAIFIESVDTACSLLHHKSFQRAGQFLFRASAFIQSTLLEENPQMLALVLDMMFDIRMRGFIDCSNIFLNQFSKMAATILPELHPFKYIFKNLSSLGSELDNDIFANAWISFLDLFEQALGAFSGNAILNRVKCIYRIGLRQDPDAAEDQLRAMVKKCKEVYGSHDFRYAQTLLEFTGFLHRRGRPTKATAAAEEVIRYAEEGNSRFSDFLRCRGMEELAFCYQSNHDHDAAESTLRQAIAVSSTIWGWQDGNTLLLLTTLERWLTEFGKQEQAADVSEQIEGILRESNYFV